MQQSTGWVNTERSKQECKHLNEKNIFRILCYSQAQRHVDIDSLIAINTYEHIRIYLYMKHTLNSIDLQFVYNFSPPN